MRRLVRSILLLWYLSPYYGRGVDYSTRVSASISSGTTWSKDTVVYARCLTRDPVCRAHCMGNGPSTTLAYLEEHCEPKVPANTPLRIQRTTEYSAEPLPVDIRMDFIDGWQQPNIQTLVVDFSQKNMQWNYSMNMVKKVYLVVEEGIINSNSPDTPGTLLEIEEEPESIFMHEIDDYAVTVNRFGEQTTGSQTFVSIPYLEAYYAQFEGWDSASSHYRFLNLTERFLFEKKIPEMFTLSSRTLYRAQPLGRLPPGEPRSRVRLQIMEEVDVKSDPNCASRTTCDSCVGGSSRCSWCLTNRYNFTCSETCLTPWAFLHCPSDQ